MEKSKVVNAVQKYLTNVPRTRDDDPLLYCYLLKEFGMEHKHIYYQFQDLNPQTVQRTRRKLQEQYPSLRGNKYELRKHLEIEKKIEYSHYNQ